MTFFCINEFGFLIPESTEYQIENSFKVCTIKLSAWEFFEEQAYSQEKNHQFIQIRAYKGKRALQIKNFVGVISAPDGTSIEVLPKTQISHLSNETEQARSVLYRMLTLVNDLPVLQNNKANVKVFDKPLIEVLISLFLDYLKNIVRKGIRKDYIRVEDEERFLKGQLRFSSQMRQPAGKQHFFQIAYDVFSENRAENRLIHSALKQITKWTQSVENMKLARELRFAFHDIPLSTNYGLDLNAWGMTRDMVSYRGILPLVKLILNQQTPYAIKGHHQGISFLFPMEKLFENYVAKKLQQQFSIRLKKQLKRRHLAKRNMEDGNIKNAFLLKPDLAISETKTEKLVAVMDTKWKLIDSNTTYEDESIDPKSGIGQNDMYQLFAYGQKYLSGTGRLALIYPENNQFKQSFEFEFNDHLTLRVIPFKLNDETHMSEDDIAFLSNQN